MKCDLCGTKVKVVGHTTKHYEPVVDREMIYKILTDHYWDYLEKDSGIIEKHCEYLADAIISAMYGGEK